MPSAIATPSFAIPTVETRRLPLSATPPPAHYPIPLFVLCAVSNLSGKSLNVIRACGQPVPPCPESTLAQLRYDAAAAERGSPPFLAGIQAALSAAAGALLGHMSGPQGRLLSWLHCLKHFFLLDQVGSDVALLQC